MISIFSLLFLMVFVVAFFTVISGFWRTRGMANKVFSLAEQEIERKLRDASATSTDAASDLTVCSHCGSRVTAQIVQCPSCGAGLP